VASLVVSAAHDPQFSRMTVVVIGNPVDFDQILRQLNKLVDVVHASHHESSDSVDREMALFKVEVEPELRSAVFQVVEVFRAKTVDITERSLIIETTGNSSKIDALERLLGTMGLVEMVRTGKLIMARGAAET
jgi:acetolactate synthase-1/3 small subunit